MRRKVLQVVGSMHPGGVETWLMHIMRSVNARDFEFHFWVSESNEAVYDKEIMSLGGHVHRSSGPHKFFRYAREFQSVVRTAGPFSVLHSHLYWYSGQLMRLGYEAGIPVRIAHSHTASQAPLWNFLRRGYQSLMRTWIMQYSTHRLAASKKAADALFGCPPKRPVEVLYCGLDFDRFMGPHRADEVKRELGIPAERKVIGNVGRFVPAKNHAFIIDLFAYIIARGTDAHLLLIGDGPLLSIIKARVQSRGLSSRCTFAGLQTKLPPLYSAMNVFVFPSEREGLGLATLEAQAAGVPVIASTVVPTEVDIIPGMVEHLPLAVGASRWAEVVDHRIKESRPRTGKEVSLLRSSRFGLQTSLEALTKLYCEAPALRTRVVQPVATVSSVETAIRIEN